MTEPEQVLVNVADLRTVFDVPPAIGLGRKFYAARARLKAVIPDPEWEPDDDMRAQYRRAVGLDGRFDVDTDLKAMYREGLLCPLLV